MKFKNRYRIESNRHPRYDYSQNGFYFITICTKNRIEWFGEINEDKMIESEAGKIVLDE